MVTSIADVLSFFLRLSFFTCSFFLDRPVTYLYNTLHYYERKLRDNPAMKRTIVGAVIGSLKDVRPANWALTEHYQLYLQKSETEAAQWKPELTYYISLLRRLIESNLKDFFI